MKLNLILLKDNKYFIKEFKKNDLTKLSLIEYLQNILKYVEEHDKNNNCKKYILETIYIEQFVGNAEEKFNYKDLFRGE